MAGGDELVTILGIELSASTLANLRAFQTGVESVKTKLVALSVVASGMAIAAGLFVKNAADEAAAMQVLSDKTGVSTDALQEWAYAAGQVGVDAKSVQNDLVSLTKSMSSPVPGQFNVNLAMIGVTVRDTAGKLRDSGDILEELSGKMSNMSAQRAMQWGQKIGISDDTVLLLRQGQEGVAKLRAEAHTLGAIIPSEAIKRAAAFTSHVASLQAVLKSMASQIAISTIPALSRVIDLFKNWIQANRAWIALHTESFMTGLVNAFERVWGAVKKFLQIFDPLLDGFRTLTDWMDTTDMYTHLISGALIVLAAAFAPVLLFVAKIVAGFLALSLVAEDVFGYLNGEDSVTGEFLGILAEKFPGVVKLFGALKDAAVSLFQGAIEPGREILGALGTAAGEVFGAFAGYINTVAERWATFISTFTDKYPALVEVIQGVAAAIGTVLGGALDVIITTLKTLFEVASTVFGWMFDAMETAVGGLNKLAEWTGFGGSEDTKKSDTSSKRPSVAPSPQRGGDEPSAAPTTGGGFASSRSAGGGESTPSRSAGGGESTPSRSAAPADMTQYAPTPPIGAAVLNNPSVQAAMQPGASSAPAPAPMGQSGPVVNDNRTVVQHINTSDPVQAGNIAAQRAGGSYTQLTNPGLNAPVVR